MLNEKQNDSGCSLGHIQGVLVVLRGTRTGNLYFLDGSTVTGTAAVSKSIEDDEANNSRLWHMRLGHAGEKALQGLVKQGLLKGAKTGSMGSASIVFLENRQGSSLALRYTTQKGS